MMKSNKLTIQINKPTAEIFEFCLNPTNTPKWVDGIAEEQTNESPPKLGTIYKNRGQTGGWTEYKLTEFEQDKLFTLSDQTSGYHVRYTLTTKAGSTKLEYYEWMDNGELADPFTMAPLQKLKQILESK